MKKDVFQAVADPTRRSILAYLAKEPMTPNNIASHFESSRQAISKHIHVLLESELVRQEESGREIYYHFNPRKMKELDKWLAPFRQLWETRFDQLDSVLKNLKKKKS